MLVLEYSWLLNIPEWRKVQCIILKRLNAVKSTNCMRVFPFLQQHLRKWMEVVVITHKGGQRSDGSVSTSMFLHWTWSCTVVCPVMMLHLSLYTPPPSVRHEILTFSLNYLSNFTRPASSLFSSVHKGFVDAESRTGSPHSDSVSDHITIND